MKNLQILAIASLMIFAAGPLQSQPILTLEEAIQAALEKNYHIRIARNDVEIAENNVTHGNAGFLPEVGITVDQNYSKTDSRQEFIGNTTSEVENARASSFQANAGAAWTIFDGMLMFQQYEQLKGLQNQEQLMMQLEMENTIANVMDVYYQIILLNENIRAIEEALAVSRELHDLAATKRDIGAGSGLDLLQAEVDVNEDESALLDQQEQLALARIRLNELLAQPAETEFRVTDTILIDQSLEYAALAELSMSQNTAVEISKTNEQLASLDLKAVRSQHFPTVQLNLGYYYNTSQSESGFLLNNKQNGLEYGATLRYNIFNGFNVQRQKENAKISIQSASLSREALEMNVKSELLAAYTKYENNLAKLQLEERNLQAAERTLDITLERYRLGDIAGIELREVRQRYLSAQSRYVLSVYNAKSAEVELRRLSGELVQFTR